MLRKQLLLWCLLLIAHLKIVAQNTFDSTGNIGMGTTAPIEKLVVKGNVLVSNNGAIQFSAAGNATGMPMLGVSGNNQYIAIGGQGLLAGTNNLQDLGISGWKFRNLWLGGFANISKSLLVNTADYNGIIVDNANLKRYGFIKYPDRAAGLWRVSGQEFEIGRVDVTDLKNQPTLYNIDLNVNGNGNVGIGTVATSQKLSVNGAVLCKAMDISFTEAEWADYVFSPGYKLPALSAVQTYIVQHKHLEGIPSAKEVQEKGVNVAQTQAVLLQKIEELTLYIIAQQKQLQLQQLQADSEYSTLEAQVTSLEQKLHAGSHK
ncbi:hypothetical protein [Filimonas lacunae]|nr:hypothetical protein [Filimonas lacunae]